MSLRYEYFSSEVLTAKHDVFMGNITPIQAEQKIQAAYGKLLPDEKAAIREKYEQAMEFIGRYKKPEPSLEEKLAEASERSAKDNRSVKDSKEKTSIEAPTL